MSRDALTLNYSIWGIFENHFNLTHKIKSKNTVNEAANELFFNQYLVKKVILNIKKGQNYVWIKINDILST